MFSAAHGLRPDEIADKNVPSTVHGWHMATANFVCNIQHRVLHPLSKKTPFVCDVVRYGMDPAYRRVQTPFSPSVRGLYEASNGSLVTAAFSMVMYG